MKAILKKELNTFFASPIAYLVIGLFLLANGLFLWVFDGNFNILNAGFADLNNFFFLSPWLLLFLIPAITMKSFSEEYNSGTIELLKTKPISEWQIILGKFFACLLLVIIAIAPTVTYVFTIIQLGNPVNNLDYGSTIGSYIGLLLLASCYTSIGLFTSTLSKNQIVSFLISIVIIFFLFYGFQYINTIIGTTYNTVELFGIEAHYKSIRRGVIDTRDIIYFISLCFLFLIMTKQRIKND